MTKSNSLYKKFGCITSYNYKNNDLVVDLSTGSFFYINKPVHMDIVMYIVPPEIDEPRIINIDCISGVNKNSNIVRLHLSNELKLHSKDFFIDRFLMVKKSDLLKLLKNYNQEYIFDMVNFKVVDKRKGEIGYVCSIDGNIQQKHIVVTPIKRQSKKILIPYVKEIVYKIENNTVYVDMPEGLDNL